MEPSEPKEAWTNADTICRSLVDSGSPELLDSLDEFCEILRSSPCCMSDERLLPLLDEVQVRLEQCRLGGSHGRGCDPLLHAVAAVEQACRT